MAWGVLFLQTLGENSTSICQFRDLKSQFKVYVFPSRADSPH